MNRTAALTPTTDVRRAPNLQTGRAEIWEARSACGRWHFERTEDPGTPWQVTYLPTGQVEWFGTLRAARRWTASPDALALLRARARDAIEAGGRTQPGRWRLNDVGVPVWFQPPEDEQRSAARVAEARRQLAVLDAVQAGDRRPS